MAKIDSDLTAGLYWRGNGFSTHFPPSGRAGDFRHADSSRLRAAGQKPNANALKRQFNAVKYQEFPWLVDVHRDSHAQPFANLAKAWGKFFKDVREGRDESSPLPRSRPAIRPPTKTCATACSPPLPSIG